MLESFIYWIWIAMVSCVLMKSVRLSCRLWKFLYKMLAKSVIRFLRVLVRIRIVTLHTLSIFWALLKSLNI